MKTYRLLIFLVLVGVPFQRAHCQVHSELAIPPNGDNERAEISQWIGLVKVTIEDRDGYEMILRLLYPTDFFGDMSLLDGEPRSATITTQEPSEVLTVSRDHFLHIIEKSPKILLKMAAVLSKRLRKTNELIHSLAFFDVYGKVARTLLNLASERGRNITGQTINVDGGFVMH